jgi:hypothetical protein
MPKTFFEFVKKYKKLKADPYLFVQFSNHSGSTLEQGAYGSPDHRDPIGVYGYPLKYVIEYPADIRYGSNAKYLRVLRNTSPMDTLVLSDLPEWRAEGLMYKMGMEPMLLRQVGRHFKINKNSSMYGKRLFGCIQYDFVEGKPVLRSGAEQTALLRKICKSVEDRAKNRNTAVINPSEPQQIIFLSRDSFKVEEVFNLRQEGSGSLMAKKDSDVTLAQRIANLVFRGMDDGIREQTVSKHEKNPRSSGTFEFFSKKGAQLSIKFDNEIPANWTFGQPTTKFKDATVFTRSFPTLEIKGPKGTFSYKFHRSHEAQEIADHFVRMYGSRSEVPDFTPITKKSHEEEKKRAEDERSRKISEEQLEKDKKEEYEFRNDYLSMAMKKYNIKTRLLDNFWYFKTMRYILQALHRRVEDTHPQNNTALPEDLEYIWSDKTTTSLFLTKKYGQYDMDNVKEIFNKIALGNPVWRSVYPWIVQMPK